MRHEGRSTHLVRIEAQRPMQHRMGEELVKIIFKRNNVFIYRIVLLSPSSANSFVFFQSEMCFKLVALAW